MRFPMNDFKYKQYLYGSFQIDEEYEHYVLAWMAYHRATNAIDGQFIPGSPDQRRVGHLAVRAGLEAMGMVFPLDARPSLVANDPSIESYTKWNSAKLEALRRLGL